MHKRVVALIALSMFGLLTLICGILTDVHDRSFPTGLGAETLVNLEFRASQIPEDEALEKLGAQSDRLDLGLVRVAPDLGGDQSGTVFALVGKQGPALGSFTRYGDLPDAQVLGAQALANSYASGQYLVTGRSPDLAQFTAWLDGNQVVNRWTDDSLPNLFRAVLLQSSFTLTIVAVTAVLVALAVYWLSVKARGRALRVLLGVPVRRIQAEDLAMFLTAVVLGAVLAARRPAVAALRRASTTVKVIALAVVLLAVGPAAAAYADSANVAAEQAQWKRLADQVSLLFPAAMSQEEFADAQLKLGPLVQDAQRQGTVALSQTFARGSLDGVDVADNDALSIVNQTWLDLMGPAAASTAGGTLEPVDPAQLPDGVFASLAPNLAIWTRGDLPAEALWARLRVLRYTGSTGLPLAAGGGGDLLFPKRALLLVVPDLFAAFDDDYLISMASTSNLLFTGVGVTENLLAVHGLPPAVRVRLVAEDGVLRAQFAAYDAWLKAAALISLVVALAVAAFVGAFIGAIERARRDFPLRLAGRPWVRIVRQRVLAEWLAGLAIAAAVLALRGVHDAPLVLAAAAVALLVSPITHVLATRWTFAERSLRRL